MHSKVPAAVDSGQPLRAQPVRDIGCIVALLALVVATWLPRSAGPIDLRWDAGVYYVLGTSLAEGKGYRLLNEPGEIHAVQYPPLVPTIIAGHQLAANSSDAVVVGIWLKRTWLVLFGVFIAATYLLSRKFFSGQWAFALSLLCVINYSLFFQSSQCTAELPFAVASMSFLIFGRRAEDTSNEVLTAASAVAAFFARTAGSVLFVAWIVEALITKQYNRALTRSALALVCIGGWSWYVKSIESSEEYKKPVYSYQRAPYQFHNVSYTSNLAYKDPFRPELGLATTSDLAHRAISNALALPEIVGAMLTSRKEFWVMQAAKVNQLCQFTLVTTQLLSIVLYALGLMAFSGLALLLSRGEWLLGLYVAGSIAVISYTPWDPTRYIAPLIPLLLICLLTTFETVSRSIATRRPAAQTAVRRLSVLMVLAAMAQSSLSLWITYERFSIPGLLKHRDFLTVRYRHLFFQDDDAALEQAVDWIAGHAKQGDVVAVFLPHWIYTRTGLKAIMPPLEADAAIAQKALDSVPVRFLIREHDGKVPNFIAPYVNSVLKDYPDAWRLAWSSDSNYVQVFERTSMTSSPPITKSGDVREN